MSHYLCKNVLVTNWARGSLTHHWELACTPGRVFYSSNVVSPLPWVHFLQIKLDPLYTHRNICGGNPYQVIIIIIILHELGFDRRVSASSDTGNE